MKNNPQYKFVTRQFVLTVFISFFCLSLVAQTDSFDSTSVNKKRLNTVIYGSVAAYTVSLVGLYFIWYQDNMEWPAHFIDDSKYWLQIDKVGHATTAYTLSNYGYWLLRWSNVPENKSIGYGAIMGFGAMTVIEILDAFSSDYGASWTDLAANTFGTGLFAGQQLLWHEQRFRLKFSFHPTEYAQDMPEKLGQGPFQCWLKDYNGQTYWLSANIKSFIKKETKFPSWINVAVGYGGKGMLAEFTNPEYDNEGIPLPQYDRVRQYYLSMDIDWTRIKTNSKALKFLFKGLSFIKLPFPTLEYNQQDQLVFHWLYF
ncbi:MAG: DUF2279 domain-containing protein [Marinilabiliales bacterium]|jgi:hypothetical protein|nr:MAG: DUF2279 domain-containing protein [Marinilabiliales bacterium]